MSGRRRVAVCHAAGGGATVIAVVPQWPPGSTDLVVAATINSAGDVTPRPLTVSSASASDNVPSRAPLAAAIAELGPFVSVEEYDAFFGHVLLDKLYLLVATGLEVAVELPFQRSFLSIGDTKWVPVALGGVPPPRVNRKDRQRIEHFTSCQFDEGYYTSEHANASTLFPHAGAAGIEANDPCQCDWAVVLRRPYVTANVAAVTSPLIRGFARGVKLAPRGEGAKGAVDDKALFVHMLGRQNRVNPGPRYYGRGLNERGQAGNDHVYELVAWRYTDAPKNTAVEFARHVYLRGTVPVRFVSKLSTSGIGEAAIIVSGDVYDGAAEYLAHQCTLLRDLQPEPVTPGPSGPAPELPVKLRCLNLLRAVSSAGEDLLTNHFGVAVRRANDKMGRTVTSGGQPGSRTPTPTPSPPAVAPPAGDMDNASIVTPGGVTPGGVTPGGATPALVSPAERPLLSPSHRPATTSLPEIDLKSVDWLGMQKDFGTPAAVAAIWAQTLPFIDEMPISAGSACVAQSGSGGKPVIDTQLDCKQARMLRINCADSLDRTNVAAFFIVTQVAVKMLHLLDVEPASVDVIAGTGIKPPKHSSAQQPAGGPLMSPRSRSPSRASESQSQPASPTPAARPALELTESDLPPCYFQSYDDFAENVAPGLMRGLVELFVANGDCVANLYTSTGALHTNVMRKLAPGMKEAPSNGIISAQRRYENMFRDKKKRRVLEALLGVRLPLHFPSLQGPFTVWPLQAELWPRAVVLMGLDPTKSVRSETVIVALQAHWAEIQTREGVQFATAQLPGDFPVRLGIDASAPIDSSEQPAADQDQSAASALPDEKASTAESAMDAQDDEALDEGAEVGTADVTATAYELMAVALLPTPDIAREIVGRGAVFVRYADGSDGFASIHPYGYTVETRDLGSTSSPAGKIVSAAVSLKRKFLRLVH